MLRPKLLTTLWPIQTRAHRSQHEPAISLVAGIVRQFAGRVCKIVEVQVLEVIGDYQIDTASERGSLDPPAADAPILDSRVG